MKYYSIIFSILTFLCVKLRGDGLSIKQTLKWVDGTHSINTPATPASIHKEWNGGILWLDQGDSANGTLMWSSTNAATDWVRQWPGWTVIGMDPNGNQCLVVLYQSAVGYKLALIGSDGNTLLEKPTSMIPRGVKAVANKWWVYGTGPYFGSASPCIAVYDSVLNYQSAIDSHVPTKSITPINRSVLAINDVSAGYSLGFISEAGYPWYITYIAKTGINEPQYNLRQVVAFEDGYLLFGDSTAESGGDRTAPHYGKSDVWIIRTDSNLYRIWDASYGGSGDEYFKDFSPLSDGSCLLVISTTTAAIEGNKGVEGTGTWIVRIDKNGAKMQEWLRPDSTMVFGQGRAYVGGVGALKDVQPSWQMSLSAISEAPFGIWSSSDLQNWQQVTNGTGGSLQFDSTIDAACLFWKIEPAQ